MAQLTLDLDNIRKAMDFALQSGISDMKDEIVKITPRDPQRLPKDPSRNVTGALKQSISSQKISDSEYKVGVIGAGIDPTGQKPVSKGKGATPAEYGFYLEFGTIRMAPRSFIRKAYNENQEEIQRRIQKAFLLFLARG